MRELRVPPSRGSRAPSCNPPEQCDEQLSHGDFFVLSSSPQGQKCVQWSVLFWQGLGCFFFLKTNTFQIFWLLCVSVSQSQVGDERREVEAEVVGFAASLSFWFALGLASPRLFPTQMSCVFCSRGKKLSNPVAWEVFEFSSLEASVNKGHKWDNLIAVRNGSVGSRDVERMGLTDLRGHAGPCSPKL